MAEKRRFFDVWILETNTVYQEVPYEVVADWLQQGRLLGDDMQKPSGTKDWSRIAENDDFRPGTHWYNRCHPLPPVRWHLVGIKR